MNPRVLLVEDNELNRYLATFLLERAGAQVTAVENGVRAVELARQTRPNVIVLDLELPEMDGYETAERLARDESTRQIPIVVVTAHAGSNRVEPPKDVSIAEVLEKPIDVVTFAQRVLSHGAGAF